MTDYPAKKPQHKNLQSGDVPRQGQRARYRLALVILLLLGAFVRFVNLDWGEGTHLHPDERYLTMVVSALRFPGEADSEDGGPACEGLGSCLGLYWDTAKSPINPMNYDQFVNYVYGTLPIFVTRAVGRWVDAALCDAESSLLLNSCLPGTYTGYGGIHYVGRSLSALADVMALLGLTLLARLIFDERVSLLAGGLYAFAVLPIQHAHFFVVDSFATVFVVWTLLLCVLAAYRSKPGRWIVIAGLLTGLAVASKISVWPLAAVVGLTGILRFQPEGRLELRLSYHRALLLVGSGVAAAFAFRVAQPYAFTGPGFFGVKPNVQWLSTIKDIRRLMSGLQDVPFGHQWTARTPILFPLRNMVFWGLGPALGLASWLGWAWFGWRLIRSWMDHTLRMRSIRIFIPWLWATGFFLYQSTQWVKSMRYLLPVYPFFALFAAASLIEWVRSSVGKRAVRGFGDWIPYGRYLMRLLPAAVFLATALWAWAFLHIYLKPVTRVTASRWIYDNIPTVVTLELTTKDKIQVPIRPDTGLSVATSGVGGVVKVSESGWVAAARVNKIDPDGVPGPREVQVIVNGQATAASVNFTDPSTQSLEMIFDPPVRVTDGESVNVQVALSRGKTVTLRTSVIANEHWDDPLPLRIDGKDPFWNWYQDLGSSPTGQMNNYDNDTEEKRQRLLAWLDEADFIVLSSNRLYASIPRLPRRYPLTTAYYRALFNGDLGYELRAEFVSYPTLGPLQFPDQEMPFDLIKADYSNKTRYSVSFPPAEEAFSVYDHPTVLVFAKTSTYSTELAEAQLPPSLLDNVQWMTPREATRQRILGDVDKQADSLLLDPALRITQTTGGTWSELFNTDAVHNRMPALSVLLWWGVLVLLGWVAFPWLFYALPSLRIRGYGLAKVVGLLLWAYIGWFLASLHFVPSIRPALAALLLLGLAFSSVAVWLRRRDFGMFLRQRWREILRLELIFLGLYLVWVGVRYLNPDLWHPVSGGEKPMDFAYFNAVIKSTWFPSYDPWFAGGRMNYYYFGFVLIGALTELLGIVPSIAYNLAVPSLFAMTGLGAYTVASNLTGGDDRRAVRAGIWGLLLILILGNLGEVQLIFKGLADLGNIEFESLIPGYPQVVSALAGLWKLVIKGQTLNFRPEWWYWDATRMIPFAEGEVGPINEFPAFTFLYADLHAHMMALPLTYVALAVALQWGLGTLRSVSSGWKRILPQPANSLLLAMLIAGALRATNTWDYPTYLMLMTFGSLLGVAPTLSLSGFSRFKGSLPQQGVTLSGVLEWMGRFLITPLLLFLGAELLFRPFVANYIVTYTAFELWKGTRTPLGVFFLMLGQFLFPLGVGVGIDSRRWLTQFQTTERKTLMWWGIATGAVILLLGLSVTLIFFEAPVGWIAVPLGLFAALQILSPGSCRRRMLWIWVGSALALSLMVEVVVLKGDIGRMNTVFKFQYQVWTLLGICAAVFVERIMHGWLGQSKGAAVREVVVIFMALLLVGAGLYPALAIPAKTQDRWAAEAPLTLDGMIFMAYATQYEHGSDISLWSDYQVIRWLQENVKGTPVIIEGLGAREYLWGSRISVYTGLPAVAAWRWHQVQQRGAMPAGTVEARMQDIRYFYNGASPAEAAKILDDYDVAYVILTPYERAYMIPEGEAKFEELVHKEVLEIAYQDSYSTIYQVTDTVPEH